MADICFNYVTIKGDKPEDKTMLINLVKEGKLLSHFFKDAENDAMSDTPDSRTEQIRRRQWRISTTGISHDIEPEGDIMSYTQDLTGHWEVSFFFNSKNSVPVTGLAELYRVKNWSVIHHYAVTCVPVVGVAVDGVDTEFEYSIDEDPILAEERIGSELFELFGMKDWFTMNQASNNCVEEHRDN